MSTPAIEAFLSGPAKSLDLLANHVRMGFL